jgi:hypothetical protein
LKENPNDSEIPYKDFISSTFKNVETVWLTTGAEILAPDYRLSKHPAMQKFLPLKTVVIEHSTSKDAL